MKGKTIKIVEKKNPSVFEESGVAPVVEKLEKQIQELYCSDKVPWVVGYSGGKDSTATLQLVWSAIKKLPEAKRTKDVFVISTDTLVENPVVAMWVTASLEKMKEEAEKQKLPFYPNRLIPEINESFWVNLIGRGYPAPRPKFRWCTERLKISPANKFILDIVNKNSEAIMVLGTRKAESQARKKVMETHAKGSTRDLLNKNPNPQFERVWIYSPIGDWINDDVWEYLVTIDNPWGYDNHELLDMYRGATEDNECPLVVDTSTPSCGDSRFGCFVCTLVDQDKSMSAMIKNDDEKKWMTPLAQFRNKYLSTDDHDKRDFRRRNGSLTLMYNNEPDRPDKLVPGPYTQNYRKILLTELLKAQGKVRASGVKGTETFTIIHDDELQAIRKIWVQERNEIEDLVPQIYQTVTKKVFPYPKIDENLALSADDLLLLQKLSPEDSGIDNIHYQLTRNLLNIEKEFSSSKRRTGIYEKLESEIIKGAFETHEEALEYAKHRKGIKSQGQNKLEDIEFIQSISDDDIENLAP